MSLPSISSSSSSKSVPEYNEFVSNKRKSNETDLETPRPSIVKKTNTIATQTIEPSKSSDIIPIDTNLQKMPESDKRIGILEGYKEITRKAIYLDKNSDKHTQTLLKLWELKFKNLNVDDETLEKKISEKIDKYFDLFDIKDLYLGYGYMPYIPTFLEKFTKLESLMIETPKAEDIDSANIIGSIIKNNLNLNDIIINDSIGDEVIESIGNVTQLRKLSLCVGVSKIPESFRNLTQLESISITEDCIINSSDIFQSLPNLKKITIDYYDEAFGGDVFKDEDFWEVKKEFLEHFDELDKMGKYEFDVVESHYGTIEEIKKLRDIVLYPNKTNESSNSFSCIHFSEDRV